MLFKKSLAGLLLRCIESKEAATVMKAMHDGECGNHAGARSLSNKILRTGYYWPTLRFDAQEYTRKCVACQRHAPTPHQPATVLHPTLSPWPFMRWGMDIVGKLPPASRQRVYFLAMTDYFSKWIEAEAYREIKDKDVISFIKRNIICRFGVPSEIVCDNGSQFISKRTRDFCQEWNIKLVTSTPRYPQSNGQAEASNKVILNNLKKRLEGAKGGWADELPLVLWADRTTPKKATGQTPFSLVYGCEAVIPAELLVPTSRYGLLTSDQNQMELVHDLDTIDERRDLAKRRLAAYQQQVAKSYNKNVRIKAFSVGDWVLRKVFPNTQQPNAWKMAPMWEGLTSLTRLLDKGLIASSSRMGRLFLEVGMWSILNSIISK